MAPTAAAVEAALPADSPKRGLADRIPVQIAMIGGGLAALVFGSRWLVEGAITVAQSLGISDLVISLTIVAAGTSLPELATSGLAAFRCLRDSAAAARSGSTAPASPAAARACASSSARPACASRS